MLTFHIQYTIYLFKLVNKAKMAQKQIVNHTQLIEFVIKNNNVAVVYFYSQCTPCKLIEPYIKEYNNNTKVALARVDTDKADDLASKFDIHAIPTFVLVRKSGGQIQICQNVVSAHIEKLRKLFQTGTDFKNMKK